MAVLQRSTEKFRRLGSSGLVWDDRFSSQDGDQMNKDGSGSERRELRTTKSTGLPASMTEKRRELRTTKSTGLPASMTETNCISPNLEQKASTRRVLGVFKKSSSANAVKLSSLPATK